MVFKYSKHTLIICCVKDVKVKITLLLIIFYFGIKRNDLHYKYAARRET